MLYFSKKSNILPWWKDLNFFCLYELEVFSIDDYKILNLRVGEHRHNRVASSHR
jgi:hypothetical protein